MSKLFRLAMLASLCILTLSAQRGGDNDPDRAVTGGKFPDGWNVRPDRGTASQINFGMTGDAYHFVMGPAGTFYRSDWTKSGNYEFSARLTQKQAPTHPISYGLSIGGTDQSGPNQTYSYFLVRSRGEDFIATGDLASARLVLQRAAEGGDPRAALTLAGTYDPIVLEKLGIQGFASDIATARTWYERAKEFGSAEAMRRLEMLASRAR